MKHVLICSFFRSEFGIETIIVSLYYGDLVGKIQNYYILRQLDQAAAANFDKA